MGVYTTVVLDWLRVRESVEEGDTGVSGDMKERDRKRYAT